MRLNLYKYISRHNNNNGQENHQNSSNNNRSSQISPSVNILSTQLERSGQPVMFSWNNNTSSSSNLDHQHPSYYESIAGSVLQYLVDSVPKLQGLYRSLLHHQQQATSSTTGSGAASSSSVTSPAISTPPMSMTRFQSQ